MPAFDRTWPGPGHLRSITFKWTDHGRVTVYDGSEVVMDVDGPGYPKGVASPNKDDYEVLTDMDIDGALHIVADFPVQPDFERRR